MYTAGEVVLLVGLHVPLLVNSVHLLCCLFLNIRTSMGDTCGLNPESFQ